MKTKHIILPIILGGMLAITSCDDDINREPSPEVLEGCQGAFFPSTNASSVELEPSEPTEITLTISRTATDAATIPIKVDINDGNIFIIPESVSFASGETSKDIKVTFPNANEGTTYNLKLKVEGDQFVNTYASTVPWVQTSVTRIKWTDVEPGVMQEGIVATFFGVGTPPFYVQMQKASLGNSTRYRLVNPFRLPSFDANGDPIPDENGIYDGYPYNEPGDVVDGEYLMVMTINEAGDVSVDPFNMGIDWGYGMFASGSIYGNISNDIEAYPLGTFDTETQTISFPDNSLYCSMAGYLNGRRYEAKATKIYLTKQAYLDANSSITDYNEVEYEKVNAAVSAFESVAFNKEWDQELWEAIDIKEDEDDSPYKNLFYLPDLYANNYGLAFYFDGEKITVVKNQPTGIKFLDNDIFVSPSDELTSGVELSSKGLLTYSFGLNFHLADGTSLGDFTETLFFSENQITRSIDDFCGVFNLNATSAEDGSALEYPVSIKKNSDGKTVTISGLLDPRVAIGLKYTNDDIIAEFDAKENSLVIETQMLEEDLLYSGDLYSVIFLTFSSDEDDLFDDQRISISCRYNDVLKFNSHKDNDVNINGFTYFAIGAGYLDFIPYNITLTPGVRSAVTESSIQQNSAVTLKNRPINKGAGRSSVLKSTSETKNLSLDNFKPQQKSNKQKRAIKLNSAPVF
jgi:hypothetical protein